MKKWKGEEGEKDKSEPSPLPQHKVLEEKYEQSSDAAASDGESDEEPERNEDEKNKDLFELPIPSSSPRQSGGLSFF